MKKRVSFIVAISVLLLFCSPIQYAFAEEQSTLKWETYSNSENVLFFPDMTEKHQESFDQNNTPYSLSIKNEFTECYAEYRREYIVEENTDYVINVFAKSSFVTPTQNREGFNSKSIMPTRITVVIGDTIIESKVSIGKTNEWQEISVGFTTGSSNSIQILLGVDFTQSGQVWFDNIRIDQPEKMDVLMLAYDSINATYDNYTYQTTRNSAITNTVITNTMIMFDNIIKELTNSKIITNTTTVFPGTLSNIHIDSNNKVYASYTDIENDIPSTNELYDFIFVLIPWNAGTFINGKDPFMGVCFSNEKIANVDQGLVAEDAVSDYNAPLDGLVHEFTHFIDFQSGRVIDTDIPFIDRFETHNFYQSPNSNALVIDDIEYLSYYDYYHSGINSTGNKNYVEKIDTEPPKFISILM